MHKNIISYHDEVRQSIVIVAAIAFDDQRHARKSFERAKPARVPGGSFQLHLVDADDQTIEEFHISIEAIEQMLQMSVTLEMLHHLATRQAAGEMITAFEYEVARNG